MTLVEKAKLSKKSKTLFGKGRFKLKKWDSERKIGPYLVKTDFK